MSTDSAKLRPSLAPLWHTLALVALIASVAVAGTVLSAASEGTAPVGEPRTSAFAVFAQILAVQAALVAYVARVGRGRWALKGLLGSGWSERSRRGADVVTAVVVIILVIGLETAWWSLVGARPDAAGRGFLPHTAVEKAAWLVVAGVVGLSEEVVYRGYLQTHLGAWVRSPALGCVLAAGLFGVAHLEQGGWAAARVGVYGLILGLVALRRRSLLPGMIAHVAIDVVAGLAAQ